MQPSSPCVRPPPPQGLGWSQSLVDALQGKIEGLGVEKAGREERIARIGGEITSLWKRLATPEDEQTQFLEAHAGLGDATIEAVRGLRGTVWV